MTKKKVLFNNGGIPMWMEVEESELERFRKDFEVLKVEDGNL